MLTLILCHSFCCSSTTKFTVLVWKLKLANMFILFCKTSYNRIQILKIMQGGYEGKINNMVLHVGLNLSNLFSSL